MQSPQPHILLSPLNWGLGHATRCIPVVRALLSLDVRVTLSAEGGGRKILQQHFPELPFIEIPGIQITYPRNGRMAFSMISQLPSILKTIKNEQEHLEKLIDENGFTHVISDNRYGLFSNRIKSAFICHQVKISTPASLKLLNPVLKKLHQKRIEKFDELWIPDHASDDRLSGALSDYDHIQIPVRHLGMLSRFAGPAAAKEKKYDFIALLSGPEPQRTLLENMLTKKLQAWGKKSLLVRGKPGEPVTVPGENMELMSDISDSLLSEILHPETCLIARPGYSTLMDLAVLRHPGMLLIPTPGQTEQEYLAGRMKTKYGVRIVKQSELSELSDPDVRRTPLPNLQTSNIQQVLQRFLGIEDPG